jgi:dihydroorotase-like cyclic amidohydrolase
MDPPPRTEAEASELRRGLREGWIDILVSDHAPHTLEEKEKADVFDVPMGIPGLETTLPLMLTRLNSGEISLERLVNCMSRRPAEIFGLTRKGRLEAGSDGDLTVIDIKKKNRIDSSNFHSKAKYSPFDGVVTTGVAVKTIVNGQVIMDEGAITAKPGAGRIVRVERA